MEVALDARVSTPRQQQPPTIDQQLSRLRDSVATHPDGHVADEPLSCDDGYSGALSSGLVSIDCEIAAPWQPLHAS